MSKITKAKEKNKIGKIKFLIGITKLKIIMTFPIKNNENSG